MSFYNTDEHTCEMVLERQQNKQEPIRSVCVWEIRSAAVIYDMWLILNFPHKCKTKWKTAARKTFRMAKNNSTSDHLVKL